MFKELEKYFKSYQTMEIIYTLVYLIIGIILIRNPQGVLHIISRVLGLALIVFGTVRIIYAYKGKEYYGTRTAGIAFNILLIAVGLALSLIMAIIETTFRVIFAVIFIFQGIMKIIQGFEIRKTNNSVFWILGLMGIAFVGVGLYLLVNTGAVIQAIGYIITVCASVNLIENIAWKLKM